ncbi:2-C-methyl-D-erythritol 4-phosphate cytidylyltransferase [Desulfatibacillum aliphaticivorans]|uniref:2-C-methyl-D-erythritol 4-phosphate cytidylyltransferase n=1 Tax=Desulfatibacillum aliphaticivorans TaxID=218208 RepID=B8FNA1_DESAL|nr:2-C-methyl-D-erythritol 4-phosphate cytidylyltransferase [Desulfatibacillum aliphaticivorans]ACL06070.1 2-C-methyl-D-erythritol 4-phosphate cytidylyltransferase [Desulfatibacillum aliphaticivorans]
MISAVIVAGGSGLRMGASVRKQYLEVLGRPILARTIEVFDQCPDVDRIILVVPQEDFDLCREQVLAPLTLATPLDLAPGGIRLRQESVYNGLRACDPQTTIAAIHDGVRPFVTAEAVSRCIHGAEESGACMLGVPAFDTLKLTDEKGRILKTVDRANMWLAQTPQAFSYPLIMEAHEKALAEGFEGTDDASLVERLGKTVHIIEGGRNNIKITTPEDLALAQALLKADLGRL